MGVPIVDDVETTQFRELTAWVAQTVPRSVALRSLIFDWIAPTYDQVWINDSVLLANVHPKLPKAGVRHPDPAVRVDEPDFASFFSARAHRSAPGFEQPPDEEHGEEHGEELVKKTVKRIRLARWPATSRT